MCWPLITEVFLERGSTNVFLSGGPGSGKGRLVANLRSMFGMRLISVESIILKYLPKKVAHSMKINSVDVS